MRTVAYCRQVAAHSSLQPPTAPQECECLVKLMGGFVSRQGASTGEQVRADIMPVAMTLHLATTSK